MPDTYVAITRPEPPAMVTLRADLSAAKVKTAIRKVTKLTPPPERRIETAGAISVAWMSPDELLVLGPTGEGARIAADLAEALKGQHHLAADVSGARLMWQLDGEAVREVLAKLTPADVAHLPVGEMRRSRLAQVAAAFWLDSPASAKVIAFRSVGDYLTALLTNAARKGSEIG